MEKRKVTLKQVWEIELPEKLNEASVQEVGEYLKDLYEFFGKHIVEDSADYIRTEWVELDDEEVGKGIDSGEVVFTEDAQELCHVFLDLGSDL